MNGVKHTVIELMPLNRRAYVIAFLDLWHFPLYVRVGGVCTPLVVCW